MENDHRRGVLWALASALSVAVFVIPWKVASEHGAASTNALILLTSAAALNTALLVFYQRAMPRFTGFDFAFACALAVVTLVGNLASAEAISLISPSLLTVVQRSEVILVALLAWPVIGERVEPRYWLGAGLAVVGLMVIQQPFESAALRTTGLAWALLAAVSFSAMAVLTRKYVHRIDLVAVNALRLWMSVAMWFALHGWSDEIATISRPQFFYASLAAFFGPFAGRLCLMASARHVEARVTTLVSLTAPPLTLLLGWLLLSDWPSAHEIQGGLILLLGVAIPIVSLGRKTARSSH